MIISSLKRTGCRRVPFFCYESGTHLQNPLEEVPVRGLAWRLPLKSATSISTRLTLVSSLLKSRRISSPN